MSRYTDVLQKEEAAARYVALFHSAFDVSYDESQDKITELHREMASLGEERIHQVSERADLQMLRKEVTAEMRAK